MATRLYLPSSGTPPLASLPINTNWELSTGLVRLPCFTTKQNTVLATSTRTWPATATQQWAWWQFQSDILKYAYNWTTADAISMVIGKCGEAATGTDTHLAYIIRIVSGDGTTIRGVIGLYHATSTEYPLVASAATCIHSARVDGATNFSSQVGDRIIIEIGVHGVTPTATNVQMRIGDPTVGNDFALTAGLTTDLRPWVELSRTVEFGTPPEEHSGAASISSNGSLIGSILKGGRGSALVSITGTLVAIGVAGMLAVASISGNGSQIASGKKTAFVSALTSGNGSLVATGEAFQGEQHEGTGVISGNGELVSEGIKNSSSSISISKNGVVSSSGIKSASEIIQISANGLLEATGSKQTSGDSFISGNGSIVAEGHQPEVYSGIGIISGNGSISSVGEKNAEGTLSIHIESDIIGNDKKLFKKIFNH